MAEAGLLRCGSDLEGGKSLLIFSLGLSNLHRLFDEGIWLKIRDGKNISKVLEY